MRHVFFAVAEGKGPTAGLKPGSPQNLLPRHLTLDAVCICASVWIGCLFVRECTLMLLYCFGSLLKDFSVSWLSVRVQRAGLWGVMKNVVQKWGIVICNMFSVTQTHLSVITSTSPRGREVRREKVHLEDGVTWTQRHTSQNVNMHMGTEYMKPGKHFFKCAKIK